MVAAKYATKSRLGTMLGTKPRCNNYRLSTVWKESPSALWWTSQIWQTRASLAYQQVPINWYRWPSMYAAEMISTCQSRYVMFLSSWSSMIFNDHTRDHLIANSWIQCDRNSCTLVCSHPAYQLQTLHGIPSTILLHNRTAKSGELAVPLSLLNLQTGVSDWGCTISWILVQYLRKHIDKDDHIPGPSPSKSTTAVLATQTCRIAFEVSDLNRCCTWNTWWE